MEKDRRTNALGESTLTVKWWAVIVVFLGLFGTLFVQNWQTLDKISSQDKRITANEIRYTMIIDTLGEMRMSIKEIEKTLNREYRNNK